MKNAFFSIALLAFSSVSHAAITVYLNPANNAQAEADYMAALAAYATITENFEDDVVWADSRNSIASPGSTAFVISQGILWTSNFAANDIATGDVGISGSFGFYSSPHGNQAAETSDAVCDVPDPIPEQCFLNDGFVGKSDSAGRLYGVGAWIKGTFGTDVTVFLDGVEMGLGNAGTFNSWTFVGVVDTAGFDSFEFRETDGKGGQAIYIFADDVTVGASSSPPAPITDTDGDGVADSADNCPTVANPGQQDTDNDSIGDACDALTDADGDGVADSADNCPTVANPGQQDTDNDSIGDACDALTDVDGDGFADSADNCPVIANFGQQDTDGDGVGNVCDADDDNDGLTDDAEINTYDTNPVDADTDNDGLNDGYEVTEGFNPLDNSDCPDWICIGSSKRGWRLGLGL